MGNDNSKNNNNNNNYHSSSNYDTNSAIQKYKQQNGDKDQKIRRLTTRFPNLTKKEATDILESFNGDVDEALSFCEWNEKEKQQKQKQQEEEERKKRLQAQQLRLRQQEEEERKKRLQLQRYQEQEEEQRRQQLQVARTDDDGNDDENKEEQMEQFIALLASVVLIEKAGFDLASQENCDNIITKLKNVKCENRTLLRDGICIGISHLLKLKAVLLRLKAFAEYKFIHIVLTDGEDTGSTTTVAELKQLFTILNKEIGDACKTFFIGIQLDNQGTKELKELVSLAGDAAEFHRCDDVGITDIFNRIQLQLVRRQEVAVIGNEQMAIVATRQNYGLQLAVNHYLVLFTLDTSGSMAGGRWKQVVASVAAFLQSMPSRDIFGILLFNDKIRIVTGSEE